MISKQMRIRNLRATLNYISGKEDAVYIDSNLLAQSSVDQMRREMEFVASQNSRKEYKYLHLILALPPGENLPQERWQEVLKVWFEGMHDQEVHTKAKKEGVDPKVIRDHVPSFEDCPFVAWMHKDQKHEHVHVALSMIDWDGQTVSDSFNWYRSQAVCRQIEREFGLQAPVVRLGEGDQSSEQATLQQIIAQAAADKPSLGVLLERLSLEGVEVDIPLTRTGKAKGIKYKFSEESEWVAGTDLGKAYTLPGLSKHLQVEVPPAKELPSQLQQWMVHLQLDREEWEQRRQRRDRKEKEKALRNSLPPDLDAIGDAVDESTMELDARTIAELENTLISPPLEDRELALDKEPDSSLPEPGVEVSAEKIPSPPPPLNQPASLSQSNRKPETSLGSTVPSQPKADSVAPSVVGSSASHPPAHPPAQRIGNSSNSTSTPPRPAVPPRQVPSSPPSSPSPSDSSSRQSQGTVNQPREPLPKRGHKGATVSNQTPQQPELNQEQRERIEAIACMIGTAMVQQGKTSIGEDRYRAEFKDGFLTYKDCQEEQIVFRAKLNRVDGNKLEAKAEGGNVSDELWQGFQGKMKVYQEKMKAHLATLKVDVSKNKGR